MTCDRSLVFSHDKLKYCWKWRGIIPQYAWIWILTSIFSYLNCRVENVLHKFAKTFKLYHFFFTSVHVTWQYFHCILVVMFYLWSEMATSYLFVFWQMKLSLHPSLTCFCLSTFVLINPSIQLASRDIILVLRDPFEPVFTPNMKGCIKIPWGQCFS